MTIGFPRRKVRVLADRLGISKSVFLFFQGGLTA